MIFEKIISKYYPSDDNLRRLLLHHSRQVAHRALEIVECHKEWGLDADFVEDAAMLHDVGIFLCDAPGIYCTGDAPYLMHGVLGASLLRSEMMRCADEQEYYRLERMARVCERHTGTGLTAENIRGMQFPLQKVDLLPETIEEQIICYADKFYSKSHPHRERTVESTAQSLRKFGEEGVCKFMDWARRFEGYNG